MRKHHFGWMLAAAALTLSACGSPDTLSGESGATESGDAETITIGSANFSENVLLANIFAEALKDDGFKTVVKPNIGSREVLIPALQDGSVDVVPEYSGSLLAYLDNDSSVYEEAEIMQNLQAALPEDLTLLAPADAQNKDSIVTTREFAEEHGLVSITDLEPIAGDIVFGGPPESIERRAGLLGMQEVYGLDFKEYKPIDLGGPLTISALKNGDVQIAQMYSTQPAIDENDFVMLEDPLHTSTAEQVVPLVRASVLTDRLASALERITSQLTTEDLIVLNGKVETDKEDPQKVARQFVDSLN